MPRKKSNNTAEIGFEQQIWSAADKLRGNIDASEYKNVVLGLIFLKYIGTAVGILDQIHPMRLAPNPFGTAWGSCNPGRS